MLVGARQPRIGLESTSMTNATWTVPAQVARLSHYV